MLAVLLLLSSPAVAQDDLNEELAAEKARSEALAKKSKIISAEVSTVKSKLIETSATLRETEKNLSESEKKLKELKSQEDDLNKKLYETQKTLGGLVVGAQRYTKSTASTLLLKATPGEIAKAELLLKSMIPEMNKQTDKIKLQIADIIRVQNEIINQKKIQAGEIEKYNSQQVTLKKFVDQRQAQYDSTESERKKQEAEVQRLADKARNLEDLVSKIHPRDKRTASSYTLPGNILLPVHGKVQTGFNETDDLGAKSKGVTFTVRSGATVVTPLAGKVKFAGPFQKYRQILIIEHRGGYHSLLAGLGRIDTVVGAALDAGEPVGTADTSPSAPRVYYELRHNGAPVNPQKLLAEQRKQDKS